MSAFVVRDETITRIVSFARYAVVGSSEFRYPAEQFFKAAQANPDDIHHIKGLASELFNLNVASVNARYGENQAAEFRPLTFKYVERGAFTTPMQAYKSLNCLIYQCSEGDVPEMPLYKAMQDFQNAIAHTLVCKTDAYEKASWD